MPQYALPIIAFISKAKLIKSTGNESHFDHLKKSTLSIGTKLSNNSNDIQLILACILIVMIALIILGLLLIKKGEYFCLNWDRDSRVRSDYDFSFYNSKPKVEINEAISNTNEIFPVKIIVTEMEDVDNGSQISQLKY